MAEVDQAPLIDLADVRLGDLLRGGSDTNQAQLRLIVERILRDLRNPDGVISAFGSFTNG